MWVSRGWFSYRRWRANFFLSRPMEFQTSLVTYGSVVWGETVRLRETVLRTPLGLAFSNDELARESAQLHLALYTGATLAGVVVLVPPPANDVRAWKLRQMAVAPAFRGKGGGAALVAAAEREMRARGAAQVMLHARETAVPFYARHGYRADDEAFEEVTIQHRRMWKELDAATCILP